MSKKIDYDLLFSKKPFNSMESEKLEHIKQIHKQMQSSDNLNVFALMQELKEIFANEKPLTISEINDIILAFKETMTKNESEKLDALVSMAMSFYS